MMLAGFRSRCTTPASCAAARPEITERASLSTRSTGNLPSRLRTLGEVLALQVRHGDVLHAVQFADVVHADDVLVRDLARQQEFLLEPPVEQPRRLRIGGEFLAHRLDRHGDAQLVVQGLVDRAHAARAEQLDDVIPLAERLADQVAGLPAARSGTIGRGRSHGHRARHVQPGGLMARGRRRWKTVARLRLLGRRQGRFRTREPPARAWPASLRQPPKQGAAARPRGTTPPNWHMRHWRSRPGRRRSCHRREVDAHVGGLDGRRGAAQGRLAGRTGLRRVVGWTAAPGTGHVQRMRDARERRAPDESYAMSEQLA